MAVEIGPRTTAVATRSRSDATPRGIDVVMTRHSVSLRSTAHSCIASLAVCALLSLVGLFPSSASATPTRYLLALGDSLAAGYQPADGQRLPPVNTMTGFRDQGYPGSYASDIASTRGLVLVDLGCPGETTNTMTGSPAEAACATLYRQEFGASSQLAAARAFLTKHPDQVEVVTLDIGANDLDRCASPTLMNYNCFAQASQRADAGRTTIIGQLDSTLRRQDPTAHFATMNYYDPFLGLADRPGGVVGVKDATESLIAVNTFNQEIASSAKSMHIQMADVAAAFQVDSLLPVSSYGGRRLPRDVVETCQLTWMCVAASGKSAPADIHPNAIGYRVIASAFDRVLPASPRS